MQARLAALTLGLMALAASVCAQNRPPLPARAVPCLDLSAKPAATKPVAHRGGLIGRAERMAGVSTSVDITTDLNVCPLSAHRKFVVWAQKSYSPANLVVAAFDAAIWQATEGRDPRGFGQGWDSFGARFGASLANAESSRLFQTLVFPVLLREDPRYFREARGSTRQRLTYALTRVAVARTDRGTHRFNFSEVLGAFAAAGLSNAYYPQADRNLPRTLRAVGLSLGTSAAWNILYEFGPDIVARGKKKSASDTR